MRPTISEKRATFRQLHETGCFVMPNPWDAGSAAILEDLGFKALASTSAGLAWSQARPDNALELDTVLAHLAVLAVAVDIPVNADFENAFAEDPDSVEANVARAIETGVAGLSVEDGAGGRNAGLYDFDLSVERIAAARAAIDRSGHDVFLTARSEGFFIGQPDFDETVRRLTAYAQAGADCLYAPGLREEDQIAAVVQAVTPKPVNVLTLGLSLETLAGLGARRISVGGSLAHAAYAELWHAAKDIADTGAFETSKPNPGRGVPFNRIFSKRLN